jgi:hypothetical protein
VDPTLEGKSKEKMIARVIGDRTEESNIRVVDWQPLRSPWTSLRRARPRIKPDMGPQSVGHPSFSLTTSRESQTVLLLCFSDMFRSRFLHFACPFIGRRFDLVPIDCLSAPPDPRSRQPHTLSFLTTMFFSPSTLLAFLFSLFLVGHVAALPMPMVSFLSCHSASL